VADSLFFIFGCVQCRQEKIKKAADEQNRRAGEEIFIKQARPIGLRLTGRSFYDCFLTNLFFSGVL